MIDISNKCVFSGSKEKLTLTMVINVNGEDWKVAVSSEHEDTATPGAIKKLIAARLIEIEDLKAKAALLGMKLVPIDAVVPQPQQPQQPQPVAEANQQRQERPKSRQEKEPPKDEREALQRLANSTTKHTLQQVTAPSGRPITLPKKEVGGAGTTDFQIINTSNKELLSMVDNMNREGNPTFGQQYSIRDCGSCKGTGKKGTVSCAACKGRGLIG